VRELALHSFLGAEVAARPALLGSQERVCTAGTHSRWKDEAVLCDFYPHQWNVQINNLGPNQKVGSRSVGPGWKLETSQFSREANTARASSTV
jgi:hypothetical protein